LPPIPPQSLLRKRLARSLVSLWNMRRLLGLLLTLLVAVTRYHGAAIAASSRPPLLLSQALHYALDHSPSIISSKSSITDAQGAKLGAVAALLPKLSLTESSEVFTPLVASGNSIIGGVVVPSGHGYNANVATANVSLTLFSGGKDTANLHASLNALRSANFALTATLDTVFDQLLTDFTAVGIDQVTLRGAERIVRLNEDLISLTRLRLHGKIASELDVIKAEQQLLQARLQASEARGQRVSDLEKVYTDIGMAKTAIDLSVDEWVPSAPPSLTHDLLPPGGDPAVRSAREALIAAQERVMAARADYYPTISLFGQYNYLGIDPSSMRRAWHDTRANNYSFGIQVTVPVLPLYNVRSEIDIAHAGVQSAEGQYRDAQVSAATRIGTASERLREAQDAVQIAFRSVALAKHNVQLTQDRFAARQASQSDVDSAEVLAVQAAQSLAIAQLTFRVSAWERYRSLDGQDFPEQLIAAVLERRASDLPPLAEPP